MVLLEERLALELVGRLEPVPELEQELVLELGQLAVPEEQEEPQELEPPEEQPQLPQEPLVALEVEYSPPLIDDDEG